MISFSVNGCSLVGGQIRVQCWWDRWPWSRFRRVSVSYLILTRWRMSDCLFLAVPWLLYGVSIIGAGPPDTCTAVCDSWSPELSEKFTLQVNYYAFLTYWKLIATFSSTARFLSRLNSDTLPRETWLYKLDMLTFPLIPHWSHWLDQNCWLVHLEKDCCSSHSRPFRLFQYKLNFLLNWFSATILGSSKLGDTLTRATKTCPPDSSLIWLTWSESFIVTLVLDC